MSSIEYHEKFGLEIVSKAYHDNHCASRKRFCDSMSEEEKLEWKRRNGEGQKKRYAEETSEQKNTRIKNQTLAANQAETLIAQSEGQKRRYANETDEAYAKRCKNQSLAQLRPEVQARVKEGLAEYYVNETTEQRVRRIENITAGKNTPEAIENTKRGMKKYFDNETIEQKEHRLATSRLPEFIAKKSASEKIAQNRIERRNQHSEWMSRAIAEGRLDPFGKFFGYFYTKNNERIGFSSSYELCRFLQLEEANIEFRRYHGIRIPYSLDGTFIQRYTPDLLRIDDYTFEEIKPESQANDLMNIAKWSSARKFCEESKIYRFETIFENVVFRDISYVDFLKSMLVFPLRNRIEITEEVENRIQVNCKLKKAA
jgi:RPA family protein